MLTKRDIELNKSIKRLEINIRAQINKIIKYFNKDVLN